MRVPLGYTLESRDGGLTRDELVRNMSQDPDGMYKRAGTTQAYSATAGNGYGVFTYGGHIYAWTSANTATTPSALL